MKMKFPSNVTYFQMLKAFNYKFGYCENDNIFYNYSEPDENKKLNEIFTKPNDNFIHYYKAGQCKNININS